MIEGTDLIAIAVRAAMFIATLQAAGVAMFITLYRRNVRDSLGALTRIALRSAWIAVALVVASQALNAARMAGAFSGMTDAQLEHLSWFSSNGAASIVRMLGLVLLVWALIRNSDVLAWIGAGGAIASFAFTGHTTEHPLHLLLAALLIAHLAIVAFWFGALPGLLIAVRHNSGTQAVGRFSLHATRLVPWIAVAGILLAIALLPNLAALWTPYGLSLIAKFSGFLLLMLLAALNKFRLAPGIERGDRTAAIAFQRSAIAEYVLIVGVLTVTATMTTLFSPE